MYIQVKFKHHTKIQLNYEKIKDNPNLAAVSKVAPMAVWLAVLKVALSVASLVESRGFE